MPQPCEKHNYDVRNLGLRRLGMESTGYLKWREYHQSPEKHNYDVMDQQLRKIG
jgi:hypothetical protein